MQKKQVVERMFTSGRLIVGAASILCAIGLTAPIFAQTAAVELTGDPFSTGLSGFPGSKFTLGDPDSSSRALVAVLSRERSDEPCFVSVGWEDVNQSSTNDAITKDLCGGNGPSSGTMGGTYGPADRVFITGVQVCMNKDDDRIKGIHLHGKRITDEGTLVDFGPDEQDSRTNCHQDHWKRWVNCPAGQVATAAIIHFEAGNTPRSWTGIGLQCRGLRVTGASAPANTPTSSSSKGLAELIDCSDTEEKDMRAVAWNIADDWNNFSKAIENATGINTGSCLEKRFAVDGKVECVHKEKCKQDGNKCKLGFGAGLGSKIKLYQTFFDNIQSMPQADRRACYAALMTHEFSHTCEHYAESGPEARAVAAFDYWKGRFPVSSGLKVDDDCGLND
ncbi:MAG TPA: hypothetical protein VH394_07045 [Thermoanaerobaculia bacterium]|jgi:hypothetical protein|nr:hypothetical protein [Thermoanaerobaculia bacterium]